MTRQIVLRTPTSVNRRQPLLANQKSSRGSTRLAEVAGGTTAECAAVCCCCPCALANFILLAVYKVPAGLCRKALRQKRRHRLIKKGLLPPPPRCGCNDADLVQMHPFSGRMSTDKIMMMGLETDDKDTLELDKEVWDTFYSTGFWRSRSERSNE